MRDVSVYFLRHPQATNSTAAAVVLFCIVDRQKGPTQAAGQKEREAVSEASFELQARLLITLLV